MNCAKYQDFEIPDSKLATALDVLGESGNWVVQNAEEVERTYFDTFDWRIYHHGWILYRESSSLAGRPIGEFDRYETIPVRNDPIWPADLKDGDLKKELLGVCKERRLFPKLTCHLETKLYHLCDALDKTRLRLQVDRFRHDEEDEAWVRLRFKPLLGYEKSLKSSLATLKKAGFKPTHSDLAGNLFKYCKRDLRPSKERLRLSIPEGQSLQWAIAKQLRRLKDEFMRQVPGIEADWDVEFLHQFRVAIRWSRALLSTFKKHLPEVELETSSTILRHWGKRTNALRDLDVLLLDRAHYTSLLPEAIGPALKPFFDGLTQRRKDVHRALVQDLQSPGFESDMHNLSGQYRRMGQHFTAGFDSHSELLDQVQARLTNRYRKMMKLLKTCLDGAHESQLHRLRIQAKKLRYVLATFQTLFDEKPFRKGIRALKKVQKILGNRHDLEWQRGTMLNASTPSQNPDLTMDSRLAIAMLAGVIHANHRQSWASVEQVGVVLKHQRLRALLRHPDLHFTEDHA